METKQNFSHEIKNYLHDYNSVLQLDKDYNCISIYFDTEMASTITHIPESIIIGASLNKEMTKEGFYFILSKFNPVDKACKKPILVINKLGLIHKVFSDSRIIKNRFKSYSSIIDAMKFLGREYAYGFYWKNITSNKNKIELVDNVKKYVYNRESKIIYNDIKAAAIDSLEEEQAIYEEIFKPNLLYNTNKWIYVRTTLEYSNAEIISAETFYLENSITAEKSKFDGIQFSSALAKSLPIECKVKEGRKFKKEKQEKQSIIHTGYEVLMVNKVNLNIILRFKNANQATKYTGVFNINKVLKYNELKNDVFSTAGGYIWLYEKDYNKFIENQIQDML